MHDKLKDSVELSVKKSSSARINRKGLKATAHLRQRKLRVLLVLILLLNCSIIPVIEIRSVERGICPIAVCVSAFDVLTSLHNG